VLTIDGSAGEGGGQILRSALALSLCTGTPFRIVDIRGRRARSGLRPQHLVAVEAAAEIAHAAVTGAALGAAELSFAPGEVRPGRYRFSIGTAGSAALVLQTVLPALLTAGARSRLAVAGGTHNPQAPSFDFLARAFLPLISRLGPGVAIELERPGFYPLGGGELSVRIEPVPRLLGLELTGRGPVQRVSGEVLLSRLPRHIAQREMATLCAALGLPREAVGLRVVEDSPGPGNVVTVFVESDQVVDVFTAYGRRGVPAERVAEEAATQTQRYLDANVPVGPYLADQLLLPLALAGSGRFVTMRPTDHVTTNIGVIERFLPVKIECAPLGDGQSWLIEVKPR